MSLTNTTILMNKFTFISVPRTGSVSMHTALDNRYLYNHWSARKVKLEGFSFGFVRNPYSQLYSWFMYHRRSQPNTDLYQGDFNEWVPESLEFTESQGRPLWHKTISLRPGSYAYKYLVDGCWIADPNNESTIEDAYGGVNSLISL